MYQKWYWSQKWYFQFLIFLGRRIHKIEAWVAEFIKIEVWVEKLTFFKTALNRLLTLPDYSIGRELLKSSGIINFENKNISVVTKHSEDMEFQSQCHILLLHIVQISLCSDSGVRERRSINLFTWFGRNHQFVYMIWRGPTTNIVV